MGRETGGRDTVPGFAEAIKARRDELRLTLVEVAERTGTSHAALSRLENGKRAPSLRLAVALAGALRWTIGELVEAAATAAKSAGGDRKQAGHRTRPTAAEKGAAGRKKGAS